MNEQNKSTGYRSAHSLIVPNSITIGYCAVASLFLQLLTAVPAIVERFELSGAQALLETSVGSWITGWLSKIDDFSLTKNLVMFIFWGAVGLVAYTLAAAFLKVGGDVSRDAELQSTDYIHPEKQNKRLFWRREIKKIAVLGLLVVLATGFTMIWLGILVPMASVSLKEAILDSGVSTILFALLTQVLAIAGLVLVVVAARLVRYRRYLFS